MRFDVAVDAYDRFMGRYSRLLSPLFADFAGVAAGHRALDVGCGVGSWTGFRGAAGYLAELRRAL